MTKPVFDIVPEFWPQHELFNNILLIEVSEKLVGFLVYDKEKNNS